MRILKSLIGLSVALFLCAALTQASTVTFAQFTETAAGGNFSTFTNSGNTATLSISEPVLFQYVGLSAYAVPQDAQAATLTLTATSTTPAASAFGLFDIQTNFYGSFSFQSATNINLLSGVFAASGGTGAAFFGAQGGNSGAFATSEPLAVSFSSSYLSFASNPNGENFALSFSSLEPSVNFANGRISPFTAAVTGTFASDPGPVGPATPEPAFFAPVGIALAGFAVFRRRQSQS